MALSQPYIRFSHKPDPDRYRTLVPLRMRVVELELCQITSIRVGRVFVDISNGILFSFRAQVHKLETIDRRFKLSQPDELTEVSID